MGAAHELELADLGVRQGVGQTQASAAHNESGEDVGPARSWLGFTSRAAMWQHCAALASRLEAAHAAKGKPEITAREYGDFLRAKYERESADSEAEEWWRLRLQVETSEAPTRIGSGVQDVTSSRGDDAVTCVNAVIKNDPSQSGARKVA